MKASKRTTRTLLILTAGIAMLILFFLSGPAFLSRVLSNAGMLALNPYSERVYPRDLTRAQNLLTEALQWDPANAAAHRGMAYILWARGQQEQAGIEWRKGGLVLRDFTRPGTRARRNKDFAQGLTWYKKAVVTFPEQSMSYVYAGIAQEESKDWQGALDVYEKALEVNAFPDDWWSYRAHNGRGGMLEKLERTTEAIEEYGWLVAHYPEDYWAIMNLGQLLWEANHDAAGAEALFLRCIQINSTEKWAFSDLGGIYYETNRLAQAGEMYRKVLEIDPDDKSAQKRLNEITKKSR